MDEPYRLLAAAIQERREKVDSGLFVYGKTEAEKRRELLALPIKEQRPREIQGQSDSWKEASLTADIDEVEHVIYSHISQALPLAALMRFDKEKLAQMLLDLRKQWHDDKEWDALEDEREEAKRNAK